MGNLLVALAIIGTAGASAAARTITFVPYFPAASDSERQGFVRLVNHGQDFNARVEITATDDWGTSYGKTELGFRGKQAVHFNSEDLEVGDPERAMDGVGRGVGDWRLSIKGDSSIEVLTYIRTPDGFLTPMFDVVPEVGNTFHVPTFNPGKNKNQVSELRLINRRSEETRFWVDGVDDSGGGGAVSIHMPPGRAAIVSAEALEGLGLLPEGIESWGQLGLGQGKWRLTIRASNADAVVMNLMSTPTGHVTNLSDSPSARWRGLVVENEDRCAYHDYDRADYGTRYRSKEDDIVVALGGIFSPYTNGCFASTRETDIEHIVALHEAHTSGMCRQDEEGKRRFAGDLLNLTLADPATNRQKSNLDALDWLPDNNRCWFANRVVEVKLKWGLSVDRDEASALEAILRDCESTMIEPPSC